MNRGMAGTPLTARRRLWAAPSSALAGGERPWLGGSRCGWPLWAPGELKDHCLGDPLGASGRVPHWRYDPAGLVERFLRSVHGCLSLIACTAQLASELGAPWALGPTSALWGRIGDCPPCMGCKTLSSESCAAGESAVTSLSFEALPYCSGRDS